MATLEIGAKFKLRYPFTIGVRDNSVVNVFSIEDATVFCTLENTRRILTGKRIPGGAVVPDKATFILPIHHPLFGIHYYKGVDKIWKDPYRGINPEYTLIDASKNIVQLKGEPASRYRITIPPTFIFNGEYLLMPVNTPGNIIVKQAMSLNKEDVSRLLTSLSDKVYGADTIQGEALYYIFKGKALVKIFNRIPKRMLDKEHESVEVMLRTEGVEMPIKLKYLSHVD